MTTLRYSLKSTMKHR